MNKSTFFKLLLSTFLFNVVLSSNYLQAKTKEQSTKTPNNEQLLKNPNKINKNKFNYDFLGSFYNTKYLPAIGLQAGTLGIGLNIWQPLNQYFTLRLNVNYLPKFRDTILFDTQYESSYQLPNGKHINFNNLTYYAQDYDAISIADYGTEEEKAEKLPPNYDPNKNYVKTKGGQWLVATPAEHEVKEKEEVTVNFFSVGLLMDYHPFKNAFYLSGGLYYLDNRVSFADKSDKSIYDCETPIFESSDTGDCINDSLIKQDAFKVGFHNLNPYFGLGYVNTLSSHKGLGVSAQIGLILTHPEASEDFECSIKDDPKQCDRLRDRRDRDLDETNDDFKALWFYPVISVGIVYKF